MVSTAAAVGTAAFQASVMSVLGPSAETDCARDSCPMWISKTQPSLSILHGSLMKKVFYELKDKKVPCKIKKKPNQKPSACFMTYFPWISSNKCTLQSDKYSLRSTMHSAVQTWGWWENFKKSTYRWLNIDELVWILKMVVPPSAFHLLIYRVCSI